MIGEIWNKQSRWSQAADALKHRVTVAHDFILAFTVAGAGLSATGVVVGVDTDAGQILVYAAAAVAAAVTIANAFAGKEALEPWTTARAVSEAIKSEVYTYLPRAGDYATGDADEKLAQEVERLEETGADLTPKVEKFTAKTRKPPEIPDAKAYADVRVRSQIDAYYRVKAGEYDTKILIARVIEVALGALGAALAVIAAARKDGDWAVWVPVVTTATTALAAHVAAERWRFLRLEFSRTALQLSHLLGRFERGKLKGDEFIVQSETAISLQNAAWVAKFAAPDAPAAK
jgi:hypothetical protein